MSPTTRTKLHLQGGVFVAEQEIFYIHVSATRYNMATDSCHRLSCIVSVPATHLFSLFWARQMVAFCVSRAMELCNMLRNVALPSAQGGCGPKAVYYIGSAQLITSHAC